MLKHIVFPIVAMGILTWQGLNVLPMLFMSPNDPAFPMLGVALSVFMVSAWTLIISSAVIYALGRKDS
jgi:hypothetical protein